MSPLGRLPVVWSRSWRAKTNPYLAIYERDWTPFGERFGHSPRTEVSTLGPTTTEIMIDGPRKDNDLGMPGNGVSATGKPEAHPGQAMFAEESNIS